MSVLICHAASPAKGILSSHGEAAEGTRSGIEAAAESRDAFAHATDAVTLYACGVGSVPVVADFEHELPRAGIRAHADVRGVRMSHNVR